MTALAYLVASLALIAYAGRKVRRAAVAEREAEKAREDEWLASIAP